LLTQCKHPANSGTTGPPKAAKVIHHKVVAAGVGFSHLLGLTEIDRIYTALPLYHSAGSIIAVGISW